jgi:hypothetical protein
VTAPGYVYYMSESSVQTGLLLGLYKITSIMEKTVEVLGTLTCAFTNRSKSALQTLDGTALSQIKAMLC